LTAPELSAAILGHVLDEYTQAETTFKALGALNPTAQERASHIHGLFIEREVLSDFTGQSEITRGQSGVGKLVRFNYTSVQYDILTKGDTGPTANVIEKVTKKTTP